MLTFLEYVAKYPVFSTASNLAYDSALADSILEIGLTRWGVLEARALEMLTGHVLYLTNPTVFSAASSFSSVRVDTQGYTTSNNSSGSFDKSTFGKEYLRLLSLVRDQVQNVPQSLASGRSYITQRPPSVEITW